MKIYGSGRALLAWTVEGQLPHEFTPGQTSVAAVKHEYPVVPLTNLSGHSEERSNEESQFPLDIMKGVLCKIT